MSRGPETRTTRNLHQPKSWLRRFALPIALAGAIVAGGAYVFRDKIFNFFNPQPPKITAEILAALDPSKCTWNVSPDPINPNNDPRVAEVQDVYVGFKPQDMTAKELTFQEVNAATAAFMAPDLALQAIIAFAKANGTLPGNFEEQLRDFASTKGEKVTFQNGLTPVFITVYDYYGQPAQALTYCAEGIMFAGRVFNYATFDSTNPEEGTFFPLGGSLAQHDISARCIGNNGTSWKIGNSNPIEAEWMFQNWANRDVSIPRVVQQ